MRHKLKDTHPLSFSKEWPENVILNICEINAGRSLDDKILKENPTAFKNDKSTRVDNTNRTYCLNWIPSDSKTNFDKLTQEGFSNKFDADSFNYELGEHGFRCDNFDTMDFTKKSIIYLGCSHTFGIGSPEEDIWCSILHKLLQEHHNTEFNYINLGVGGGCIDDYLRFMPYMKRFNPHTIVSCTPPTHRMILCNEVGAGYMGMWLRKSINKHNDFNAFFELLKYNEEYFLYKYDMTLHAIKSLADAMEIEFHEANIRDTFFDIEEVKTQLGDEAHGRDGSHYSRKIHEMFATSYFKKITEE